MKIENEMDFKIIKAFIKLSEASIELISDMDLAANNYLWSLKEYAEGILNEQ